MKHLAALFLSLSAVQSGFATASSHFDKCDNIVDSEKGELPGGPLIGVGMLMYLHSFARLHCKADLPPMEDFVQPVLDTVGCGPKTKIALDLTEGMRVMRNWTLEDLLTEGNPSVNLSAVQVEQAASQTEKQLGGCDDLVPRFRRPNNE